MLVNIISCCFFFFLNTAENCNDITSKAAFQPRTLWQCAAGKLAQEYKNKSNLEQQDTIKRWINILPEDVWKKILNADPLQFLRFEKADWFLTGKDVRDLKSSSGLTWLCNINNQFKDRYIYSVISNQQKKLVKKVELNNLLPLWVYISDTMFVWAELNQSFVHIYDFDSQSEYTFNLGINYDYCIPSDTEPGVLYLFDTVIWDTKKTLNKVCCTLNQSGKVIVQQIDLSYFVEPLMNTTFIQTMQLDKYLLCNGQTVYLYNTLEGTIRKLSLVFDFDCIMRGTDPSKVIFYSQNKDNEESRWRVFSIDNLQLPLYEIVTKEYFHNFLKLDLEDRLIFCKNGMLYDSLNNSTLKLDYKPHYGMDFSRGAPKPYGVCVFHDNEKNFYTITNAFALQKQNNAAILAVH